MIQVSDRIDVLNIIIQYHTIPMGENWGNQVPYSPIMKWFQPIHMYFALTNKSSQVKQQNYTDHEIKSLNMCIEKYNYVNSCLVEIPLGLCSWTISKWSKTTDFLGIGTSCNNISSLFPICCLKGAYMQLMYYENGVEYMNFSFIIHGYYIYRIYGCLNIQLLHWWPLILVIAWGY